MRPICCLAFVIALGLACADPPEPRLERVERIALAQPHAVEGAEAADETRPAAMLRAGESATLCPPDDAAPGSRLVLPFAARALRPRVELSLGGERVGETAVEAWRELSIELDTGVQDCASVSVEGGDAWISDALVLSPGRPRPWVIVYVVDSLRWDRTPFAASATPLPTALAPAFEALARDGLLYERAVASSSWTRPSVASILTGLGPSAHRVLDRQDRLPGWVPRLQRTFAEAGWQTVAVSSNPNILPVFGFLDGFDRFLDVGSDAWLAERGYERLGQTLQDVVAAAGDRPLFLYVHDNEPHAPYRPLERYRAMFEGAPAGAPAEIPGSDAGSDVLTQAGILQRATIRSASDRFGALMDALRRLGRYDDAVVVLTADHGEEFGEHGGTGHGHTLFEEQLHVPLVIKPSRGQGAPGRIRGPVALEAIAPTAVELAGIASAGAFGARSLLERAGQDEPPRVLVAELDLAGATAQSALRWPWKLLRTPAGTRLFDLSDDPGEQRDLSGREQATRSALEQSLDTRLALARSGLELSCVAGERDAVAEVVIELEGAVPAEVQQVGIESGSDRVEREGERLVLRLGLRPGERARGLARFDRVAVARQDPDRDRIRVPAPPGRSIAVRARGVRVEGPGGVALPVDGTPIDLAAIELPAAPPPLLATAEPRCELFLVRSKGVRASQVDAALEERLRALGYLEPSAP